MGAMTTLPWGRPITHADLDAMPDDGHRYELIDGTLLVSPAPSPLHQRVVLRLARLLDDARPADLSTYVAPLDVVLADDTVLQPDVLVARREDFTDRNLPAPPVLAVEVISPSTRRIDGLLKPARYASAGVQHYWLVDPAEPSLTAYELGPNGYCVVTVVRERENFVAERPFTVSVTPADLVADA